MKSILVVDDSPTELQAVTSFLKDNGYTYTVAKDGEEAIRKAGETSPDLMLLDVVLPKKNGFQVCRQLKSTPATSNIKIVLLTSKNQDSDKYWGIRQGADGYLTKPFQRAELLQMLTRFA
ncbi:MAG: response regulator [Candidatus Solibacter usitatus]|nr:response regulator [Candidatus Solibacter usitatus]